MVKPIASLKVLPAACGKGKVGRIVKGIAGAVGRGAIAGLTAVAIAKLANKEGAGLRDKLNTGKAIFNAGRATGKVESRLKNGAKAISKIIKRRMEKMTGNLTNDLAYLEGQISAALRHDAGRKLKCKEGYVQRGNACQKIGEKKSKNSLARNIGAGLGAAALVGGAAAIASRGAKQENKASASSPVAVPPVPANTLRGEKGLPLAKKYLAAGASTVVAVTGATIAQKKNQIILGTTKSVASAAVNKTVSLVASLLSKEKKGEVRSEKDTVSQVLIKRRIKDLNDPAYREKATNTLNALAEKPEVADAIGTFIAPELSGETDLVEAKKKASMVILKEVMVNPKARDAALKYGSSVASEWSKDPEIRRIAGEYASKTVSGGKDESKLSPVQKILRRAERDTILLGTALTLAAKKGGLNNFRENVKAKTNEKISQINERRGDSVQEDADLEMFYLFSNIYQGEPTKRADADLRNNSSYLEGRLSVSLRYDKGRKLKCKEGYVQRGNACQKMSSKAEDKNLARSIGAGLGAAALVGGATAIAASKGESTGRVPPSNPQRPKTESPTPQAPPQKKEAAVDKAIGLLSSKGARKAAIAAGSAGAVVAGVVGIGNVQATKDYKVSDIALIMTYKQSLALGKVADRALDRSDLSPELKGKAKGLIGMTKLALARKTQTVRGRDLIDVDKESNSFTYRDKKNGGIYTVASVGPALFSFQTVYKKEATGGPVYEVSFGINESNNKEESANLGASGAKQIIKLTKRAFDKHVEAMPDNSILTAGAYDKDGAGSKRKSIYEKVGFAPMEGQDPMVLYASKKDGKIGSLYDVYKPAQKPSKS
jgi:hypothetical protein